MVLLRRNNQIYILMLVQDSLKNNNNDSEFDMQFFSWKMKSRLWNRLWFEKKLNSIIYELNLVIQDGVDYKTQWRKLLKSDIDETDVKMLRYNFSKLYFFFVLLFLSNTVYNWKNTQSMFSAGKLYFVVTWKLQNHAWNYKS